jgi:aryl-alcohol dehydrogenase-like predicted oxidoreductase
MTHVPGTENGAPNAAAAGTFELGGDLVVRRLGYGAMRLPGPGVWGEPEDPEGAKAVLRRAIELGVNLLDTAGFYGPEVADRLIAEALHPYPEGLTIATKVGVKRGPDRSWNPHARPEELRADVEGDLRRLKLERLDLVYLRLGDGRILEHSGVPLAESFGALAELKGEGKIRHLGLSSVTLEVFEEAREIAPVAAVQNLYNLANRSSEALLEACEQIGAAFVPFFPLAIGELAKPDGPVAEVASRRGATPAQVALAWLLARSPAILPIPGTSSIDHLDENVAAASLELSREEVEELADAAASVSG